MDVRRWLRIATVALVALSFAVVVQPQAVAADGGYPDNGALCKHTSKRDGACSNYDWGYRSANGQWAIYSSRGYGYRNCTDFVAWKLGLPNGLGNAVDWRGNAKKGNLTESATPQVGDIAWWGGAYGGGYGHVAYVTAVAADNSVTIAEYNHDRLGNYGSRSSVRAEAYLRPNSASSPPTAGGNSGNGSPIGSLDGAAGADSGGIQVNGWSMDPDAPTSPNSVHVYLDGPAGTGRFLGSVPADQPRGDVAAAFPGSNDAHGYSEVFWGISPGPHSVYVYGINIAGGGNNPLLRTLSVQVPGATPGSPFGSFDSATGRVGGSVHLTGWTIDPDRRDVPTRVHAYIDGPAGSGARGVDLGDASAPRPDVANAHPGSGNNHGFDTVVTGLSPGSHTIWVYAINAAGSGSNPLLYTRRVVIYSG